MLCSRGPHLGHLETNHAWPCARPTRAAALQVETWAGPAPLDTLDMPHPIPSLGPGRPGLGQAPPPPCSARQAGPVPSPGRPAPGQAPPQSQPLKTRPRQAPPPALEGPPPSLGPGRPAPKGPAPQPWPKKVRPLAGSAPDLVAVLPSHSAWFTPTVGALVSG